MKSFLTKKTIKNVKIANRFHAYKCYACTYNVEI